MFLDGHARGIVVRRLGDLTNSPTELGPLLQWLVDADMLLGALDLELDSSTAAGDAAVRALIEVAAWERSRTNALAAVGSRGRSLGPAVRDDPELSARITTMRSRGLSLQAIADALNADGVPTLRGWQPLATVERSGRHRLQTPLSPSGHHPAPAAETGRQPEGARTPRRTRRERAPPDVGPRARASATPHAPRPRRDANRPTPPTLTQPPTPAGHASSGARQSRRPRRPDRPLTERIDA